MEKTLEVKQEEALEQMERDWERMKKPAAQMKLALKEATAAVGKTKSKREAVVEQERKTAERKRALAEKDRQKEEVKARKKLMLSGGLGHIWEHEQGKFTVVAPTSAAGVELPLFDEKSEALKEPQLIRGAQVFRTMLGMSEAPAGSGGAAEESKVDCSAGLFAETMTTHLALALVPGWWVGPVG